MNQPVQRQHCIFLPFAGKGSTSYRMPRTALECALVFSPPARAVAVAGDSHPSCGWGPVVPDGHARWKECRDNLVASLLEHSSALGLEATRAFSLAVNATYGEAAQWFALGDYLTSKAGADADVAQKGLRWLEKASAAENAAAAHALASWWLTGGNGLTEKDEGKALELHSKAAQLGHPESQYVLGLCYEMGLLGCAKSAATAISWFEKASEQGHIASKLNLGNMLSIGGEHWTREGWQRGKRLLERTRFLKEANDLLNDLEFYEQPSAAGGDWRKEGEGKKRKREERYVLLSSMETSS